MPLGYVKNCNGNEIKAVHVLYHLFSLKDTFQFLSFLKCLILPLLYSRKKAFFLIKPKSTNEEMKSLICMLILNNKQ